MLAATVALGAISISGLVGLLSEQNALATAQRSGSDSVEVLSAAKVLLSRAQSDQSLALVNRGTDQTDPLDFAAVMRELAPSQASGGLLGEVSALAARTRTTAAARRFAGDFAAYRTETARVDGFENGGLIDRAIAAAPAAGATSDRLSNNLAAQIAAAQQRFTRAAADATSAVSGLELAIPLITALAAALALLGLRQRINEYR
jgi:hypothetical protein